MENVDNVVYRSVMVQYSVLFSWRGFLLIRKNDPPEKADHFVDNVDNYPRSRFSPIIPMGPEPRVINRSLFFACSEIYFSIVAKSPK